MTQAVDLGFELPWEVHEMDRWLREGNPTLGWRGDPRLSLAMGVLTTQKSGQQRDPDGKTRFHRKGDKVGWCWQVLRHNEDGTDTPVLQRKGTELHSLIPALIEMDPRTPGHEKVMDRIEREDAALQKQRQQDIADAEGEHLDHLWRLVHDRTEGPSTFRQMPGRNPDKQL